jgi:hypothetical protein
MIINVEFVRISKEVVILYFKYNSSILPKQNKKKHGGKNNKNKEYSNLATILKIITF